MTYTDEEIIEAIAKNDNSGYLAIYHDRTRQLKQYIVNNGGTQDDADEIEQKTIVILFEKIVLKSFELNKETKLSTFLYAVARNLWRKEKMRMVDKPLPLSIPNNLIETDEEFLFETRDEDEKLLVQALATLGEKCQKVLKAKYYLMKSDRELSRELGDIEEGALRKKRYKCMQQLKRSFSTLKKSL